MTRLGGAHTDFRIFESEQVELVGRKDAHDPVKALDIMGLRPFRGERFR